MSAKAFYQTFFQTEQVFRRADDALAFPALYDTPDDLLSPSIVAAELIESSVELIDREPIVITINDPVLPIISVEAVVVETVLSEPEQVVEPIDVVAAEAIAVPEPTPVVMQKAVSESPQPASPNDTKPPVSRKPATPQISQKVLILVDEEMLPSDLLFLEKILKAVHLDIDGVDLLNVHGTGNVNFSELLQGKYIHHFFTFGVPFSRINLDILMDRYQPVRFDGITFLMADSLPAIETDVALKKKLWEALKKVFLWR
jgi:hypothetical protein